MENMTKPSDFEGMTPAEVREWIREAHAEYRSEKSRRHMANPANLELGVRQHHAAMQYLRSLL
jgi:hypothetical protein